MVRIHQIGTPSFDGPKEPESLRQSRKHFHPQHTEEKISAPFPAPFPLDPLAKKIIDYLNNKSLDKNKLIKDLEQLQKQAFVPKQKKDIQTLIDSLNLGIVDLHSKSSITNIKMILGTVCGTPHRKELIEYLTKTVESKLELSSDFLGAILLNYTSKLDPNNPKVAGLMYFAKGYFERNPPILIEHEWLEAILNGVIATPDW